MEAAIPPELFELLGLLVDEKNHVDWLATRLDALGGRTPTQMILAGRTAEVMDLLRRAVGH